MEIALSLSLSGAGAHESLLAETQALLSRFSVQPSMARMAAINRLIGALKAGGVWQRLDALYVLAAHDAQAAQRNWVADSYNIVPGGAPVFTADRGYQGDGNGYLDTGLNPATSGLNYREDDASFGFWSLTNHASESYDMGAFQSATVRADMRIFRPGAWFPAYLNDETFLHLAVSGATGLFSVSRVDGATRTVRANAGTLQTAEAGTTGVPNLSFHILGANGLSGRSQRQCAAAWIGGGLTEAQYGTLHGALRVYLEEVGTVQAE
ncbi:hypothetical protein [Pelagibacterium sp. H642]|uniref:hypothetical protein n=1 Tax=Pelagibacterium sp. H642 TaxID=1881069 RepID=UPI0028167E01|nr:hypothetical protein [Pelagibacterium sp. H642]WMT89097.1 hypothetical protein NO934_09685 [Pelagibacterium sp. H642]